MRGTTIGRRIYHPNNFISNPVSKHTPFLSSSPFSTSSGRGRGRGRGDGGDNGGFPLGPGQSDFNERAATGKPDSVDSKPESQPSGLGHGRGKPIASNPILPGFSTFISSVKNSQPGVGRGQVTVESGASRPAEPHAEPTPPPSRGPEFTQPVQANLPSSISLTVAGAGRGKPIKQEVPPAPAKEENRHIQARAQAQTRPRPSPTQGGAGPSQAKPKLSREDAVKRAVSLLSQGGDGEVEGGGGRGRFGPGRGRGRGRGRGWRRDGEGRERRGVQDEEEGFGAGLHLGDSADGEKFAKTIGVENMSKLIEAFEEMSGRVLPSPMEDAYLDAFHTNCMIEFEPEYLMGEFDRNPDIDEKTPMALREVLEKVKPFMVAYEGIQSQEEWEGAVEETMKNVPLLKEIVDYYSGPDRVTAKKQQEELERVAKTIPARAPDTVKRFADRAVLSLQSNPGWGFDKKCQFMDKLVREVSQQYK